MARVNYKLIKNFFSIDELKLYQKYCYNRLDSNKDYVIDIQSFSPAWYNDPLISALLYVKLPIIEKKLNLKLLPTYSYWRYYVFGADLKQHTDRVACEVSITACIKKYDNWPLIIEGKKIELEEGDGLIYAGVNKNMVVQVFIKVKVWLKYFYITLIKMDLIKITHTIR